MSSFTSFVFLLLLFLFVCVRGVRVFGKREISFRFPSFTNRIVCFSSSFLCCCCFVFSLSLSLSLSLSPQRVNSGAKKKTIALLSLLLMMMTSTSFNAWLPIIKLGTGVVIGQHFRARCAENFANDSESSNQKNLCGERERERKKGTRAHTNTFAASRIIRVSFTFLAACVRSSAGRLIPVVWSSEGFIYDCL